jgi:exonuclease, DNA polymerase III, epsilon subunit family
LPRSAWLYVCAAALAEFGILAGVGLMIWSTMPPENRVAVTALIGPQATSLVILGAVALLAVLSLGVRHVFTNYVEPLRPIAEEARLIATSNPRHRIVERGAAALGPLIGSINLLAERYQSQGEDVVVRIREANALLEEEKNTLAALMAKLTQGVLVCNLDGRILLYNQRALILLEGPARATGGGDWIGLGRSIFGIIDENLINHALGNVRHQLEERKEQGLLVPFIVGRPGGQMLSTHLVPILDVDDALRGYILTLEDVTRRVGRESRRGTLLQALTEGQRSRIAGIRAAIETILSYPDLDEQGRNQFLEVISDESLRMSAHLDEMEVEYADEFRFRWPLEEMLGSDLLATLERRVQDARGLQLEVIAPVEPVWLRVDSYALSQCLIFLVDQLQQWCRATQLRLTLEQRRSLAALQLEWDGAVLHMEALRTWALRNVGVDAGGSGVGLFEAVERHGGALWTDQLADGRPCLRVVLPVSDTGGPVETPADDAPGGHDFDFHLFEQQVRGASTQQQPLAKLAYTVFDTETTGLDPSGGDEIIAIGAVRIVNGRILHREIFDSFVRPLRPISAASQEIHGITPAMLRGKPTIDHVMPRFKQFVEDTVVVGHNVAFDMRFLEVQGTPLGLTFANPTLDTLILECVLNPHQSDKSLEAIAGRLGINVTGRHTALGDALTTAEVFLALLPQLAERNICTLDDARALCEKSAFAEIKY